MRRRRDSLASSLNGNIDGCDCKGHPRADLVKRAALLRNLKNPEQALLEYRERYALMAHNLSVCPDENSCIFFSTTPLMVERGGARIGAFALNDPKVFTLYPGEQKDKLKIQDPAAAARVELSFEPIDYSGTVERDIIIRTPLEQLPKALYLVCVEVVGQQQGGCPHRFFRRPRMQELAALFFGPLQ